MDGPYRVQLSRAKGWRMPENTVNVARPGRWGNPFRVDLLGRERAVRMFRDFVGGYFNPGGVADLTDDQFQTMFHEKENWRERMGCHPSDAIRALRGKNLACWCKPDDICHADVLLELANLSPKGIQ